MTLNRINRIVLILISFFCIWCVFHRGNLFYLIFDFQENKLSAATAAAEDARQAIKKNRRKKKLEKIKILRVQIDYFALETFFLLHFNCFKWRRDYLQASLMKYLIFKKYLLMNFFILPCSRRMLRMIEHCTKSLIKRKKWKKSKNK